MEQRTLGKTGYRVGVIAFGGIVVDQMAQDEAAEVVAEAVARGVNYFDVAPTYGRAQYILGPALQPHRKSVYLACKTSRRTAAEAQAELEESLRALRTDYFDNYQLHGLDKPEDIRTVFSPGGAMEVLLAAKRSGIARNIGFTCHQDRAALEIAALSGEFATMLFPVNFAYRAQKEGGVSALSMCGRQNLGVIAIKALAHRKWLEGEERAYPKCWYRPIYDDEELARLALNDTLCQEGVTLAVPPGDVRMLRMALRIIENQGGKVNKLSAQEKAALADKAAAVREVIF